MAVCFTAFHQFATIRALYKFFDFYALRVLCIADSLRVLRISITNCWLQGRTWPFHYAGSWNMD